MMYFSQITPNIANLENIRRLAHAQLAQGTYQEHQWIWRFFPNISSGERPFLFRRVQSLDSTRAEQGALVHLPRFYLLSKMPPQSPDSLWQVQSKPYEPELAQEQTLYFDVRINPVVTRDKKQHDLIMDRKTRFATDYGKPWREIPESEKPTLAELVLEQSLIWLEKRGQSNGFELSVPSVIAENYQTPMQEKHRHKDIALSTVDVHGILRVTDVGRFRQTLYEGLGGAKAFGCGLMLLRRGD